jgi:hypothetical protein
VDVPVFSLKSQRPIALTVTVGSSVPALTVIVSVAVDVPPWPSEIVYVKVALPVKLVAGLNETTPLASIASVPAVVPPEVIVAGCVASKVAPLIFVMVSVSPLLSVSLVVSAWLVAPEAPLSTSSVFSAVV